MTVGIILVAVLTLVVGVLGLFSEASSKAETSVDVKATARRFRVTEAHAAWILEEAKRLGCRETDIRLQNFARSLRRLEANH